MRLHLNKPIPEFSPMAIDIETSDLDPYKGRLLSVAVSNGEDVWVLLDIHGFDQIKPILENEAIQKIAHNANFEYKWFLHKLGVRMNGIFDTQMAEDTLHKGLKYPINLEDTLIRRQGVMLKKDVRKTFEDHPGFAVRPVTNEQLDYMVKDVLYLNKLRDQQLTEATPLGLVPTIELENEVVPVTAELELGGMKLDVDLWYEFLVQFDILIKKYEQQLRDIIGPHTITVEYVKGPREIPTADINFNSNPQLMEVCNERFKMNIKSTRWDTVIEPMIHKGLIKGEALDFMNTLHNMRFWKKRKGFDYPKHIKSETGKVHGRYKQWGTTTGRYSMSKPNNQQVPRPTSSDEPNLRHLWVADSKDYTIIRADYSQQEPRVFAQLCDDPAMIEACNSDDVYIEFGKLIFGHDIQKGSEERFTAKTFVLATGYGAGVDKLAAASGKDVATCQTIRNKIRKSFPIMAAYGPKMRNMSKQYGYTTTAYGRRRYFDYKSWTPYNEPLNAPVQGTAADMLKLAMIKIHTALTEMKKCGKLDSNTRVWHIVHDEIEVHCHKDEVEIVLPLVKELMEEAGREICPDVLHVAEALYGYRWDK